MQLWDKNRFTTDENKNKYKKQHLLPALKTITKLLKYFLTMFVFFLSDKAFSSQKE